MTPASDGTASEAEERFARAIAERVPAERVLEMYLFPPLRSGPIETAVAVVTVADGAPDDVSDDGPVDVPPRAATSVERHVVYTATYRHTRKGPDRGAWSVEVVAQADAPLDAVAAAVRGVYRRSSEGEAADADRLTGEQFRALVGTPTVGSEVAAERAAAGSPTTVGAVGPGGPASSVDGEVSSEGGTA
jgi:hypothetical protein